MTLIFHEFADLTLAKIKICKNDPPNSELPRSKSPREVTHLQTLHASTFNAIPSPIYVMNTSPISFAIGDQFDTIQQLKILCKQYALQENFEFTTLKSCKTCYTIKCSSTEGCPWYLHAPLISRDR